MNNYKYTSHKEILSRLAKKFKTREFDPDTIHDWCAEAENDILRDHDYFMKFIAIKLEVKNKRQATIPCNIHSLIDVYFENGFRPLFQQSGVNLILNNPTDQLYLYVDYKGTPVDHNTGDVLIMRGHEAFCEAYCIRNSFYEDYLNGKIDGQRWSVIDDEYERTCAMANQDMRNMTRVEHLIIQEIHGSMLPVIGRIPQYKGGV